jgi:tRNA(fMet)-specific endonuclease VapC
MRRFLLDTGAASDFIHRRRGVFARGRQEALRGNRIGICVPVLGELWDGVEYSATRERNAQRLRQALPSFVIWPYDPAAGEAYGRLAAELRRLGRPMQQIDIQIAAIAISLGNCTVVSSDTDLAAVPGFTVVNWTS